MGILSYVPNRSKRVRDRLLFKLILCNVCLYCMIVVSSHVDGARLRQGIKHSPLADSASCLNWLCGSMLPLGSG